MRWYDISIGYMLHSAIFEGEGAVCYCATGAMQIYGRFCFCYEFCEKFKTFCVLPKKNSGYGADATRST